MAVAFLFPFIGWGSFLFIPLFSISLLAIGSSLIYYFSLQRHIRAKSVERDNINEAINLLEAEVKDKTIFRNRLPSNIDNIQDLESLFERLNSLRSVESLPVYVLDHLRRLFPRCSNILFFDRPEHAEYVNLVESNRENRLITIQEKEGDVFEHWAVHQNKSVLVENLEEEFRFPMAEAISPRSRKIGSFMCCPLSFGSKVLGVIRIESTRRRFFDISDLRVFSAVCSLSAIFMERLILMKKVSTLAIRDGLTDLYLRDFFTKRLREEIASAFLLREHLSLLMIDIDNFKSINDTYGHSVGDMVLKEVADILNTIIAKEENLLCRFGGEEFLAFLKMPKGDAIQIAENVRSNIEQMSVRVRNNDVKVTVSIGVVTYPEDSLTAEDMVFAADTFMYKAKQSGKNMVCSV